MEEDQYIKVPMPDDMTKGQVTSLKSRVGVLFSQRRREICEILRDYGDEGMRYSQIEQFFAEKYDKHPTEIGSIINTMLRNLCKIGLVKKISITRKNVFYVLNDKMYEKIKQVYKLLK